MREATGGIYALGIVFAFIIIISSFLAFTTNYNKAFKMKNRIITILEQHHNDPSNSEVQKQIREYAQSIGYSASKEYTRGCNGVDYALDSNNTGWCYKINQVSSNKTMSTSGDKGIQEYTSTYVDVVTFVSIDVPILNQLFPNLNLFQVTGSTRQLTEINN